MFINQAALAAFLLSAGSTASAFSGRSAAFVSPVATVPSTSTTSSNHSRCACACPACRQSASGACCKSSCACAKCASACKPSCACAKCRMSNTMLFSEPTAEAETAEAATPAEDVPVPAEVEALDGVESNDEAHNVDRPARKSLKKKPKGKPLSEFNVGDMVTAKVKTLTTYGAFCDIGAATDGLVHISQLSADFVSDVESVLTAGQEVQARIIKIDADKGQVGLSMLTVEEEAEAAEAQKANRKPRGGDGGGGGRPARKDDSAILNALVEKKWDVEKFIEGTVASTVDFGAFVRVDVSQLNSEVEGEIDGLVHISALSPNRVNDVTSVVNVNDKVQVRVKSIADRKVSLTMLNLEDEAAKAEMRGGGGGGGGGPDRGNMGAKDWKESLERISGDQPKFTNSPFVVDLRKSKPQPVAVE